MAATHEQLISRLIQVLRVVLGGSTSRRNEGLVRALVAASRKHGQDPDALRAEALLVLEAATPPNPPLRAFEAEFGPKLGPLLCDASAGMRAVAIYQSARGAGVQITDAELNAKCSGAVYATQLLMDQCPEGKVPNLEKFLARYNRTHLGDLTLTLKTL